MGHSNPEVRVAGKETVACEGDVRAILRLEIALKHEECGIAAAQVLCTAKSPKRRREAAPLIHHRSVGAGVFYGADTRRPDR